MYIMVLCAATLVEIIQAAIVCTCILIQCKYIVHCTCRCTAFEISCWYMYVVYYYCFSLSCLVCSWNTSISELVVMTACKDAVSFLKGSTPTEQVVVVSELDPLVRVCHDQKTEQLLKANVVSLLTRQHDKRIKLLE